MAKHIEITRKGIFVYVEIKNGQRTELYKSDKLHDIKNYLEAKGVI